MKNYFGFDANRRTSAGVTSGMILLFGILLVPSIALWLFYRWLFADDTHLLVPIFIGIVTAWLWAYLVGYGTNHHTHED